MGKGLKLCALILGCGLVFGCAAQKNGKNAEQARMDRFRNSYEARLNAEQELAGQKLLQHAHSAIGTPYVLGGATPGGFDCSGFVSWAFKNVGVTLPRTAREQSVVGENISNIEDMRAGDIVTFRHPKRGYHTGIYVGDGKFIHSPRKRTRVRINSLSEPYFSKTLLGARRVTFNNGEDLVAQAESRLAAYAEINNARKRGTATSVAAATPAKAGKSSKAQHASKTAKVTKATGTSAKATKNVAKQARKNSSTGVRAQKVTSGKNSRNTKASAGNSTSTAAKKGNQKTLSSLRGKNARSRS